MTKLERASFLRAFSLDPTGVVFIEGEGDPLYAFWDMVHKQQLPDTCLVVIPKAPANYCLHDVQEYGTVKVGMGFIINYDSCTSVGVKPSQRGLFLRR